MCYAFTIGLNYLYAKESYIKTPLPDYLASLDIGMKHLDRWGVL